MKFVSYRTEIGLDLIKTSWNENKYEQKKLSVKPTRERELTNNLEL